MLKAKITKIFSMFKKRQKTPLQRAVFNLKKRWKKFEKRRKHWKIHIYLTLVLPVVLIAAIVKAIKTYVRLKIRELAVNSPSDLKEEKTEE